MHAKRYMTSLNQYAIRKLKSDHNRKSCTVQFNSVTKFFSTRYKLQTFSSGMTFR